MSLVVFVLIWHICPLTLFVSEITISLAAIISSASGNTPCTPNSSATLPALIAPADTDFSSQCDATNVPNLSTSIIASLIILLFTTGIPSSENAIAPAFFNSSKFTNSSPFSPLLTDAYGKILHKFTLLASCIIFCNVSTLSGVGFVFGIGHIVVNPPATALFEPVSIVSLCSPPGSLKWQCISIIPGIIYNSVQSISLSTFSSISFSTLSILSFSISISYFSSISFL